MSAGNTRKRVVEDSQARTLLLAELGAKCLEQLQAQPWYGRDETLERLDRLTMIEYAARDLGLLGEGGER